MKKTLRVLLPCMFIMLACQKEISEIIAQNPNCRIQKGYYHDPMGFETDSMTMTYTNGKLTRMQADQHHYQFTYSGNNIVLRQYFETATNTLLKVDSVIYNADNTVQQIRSYDYTGVSGIDTVRLKYLFQYSGSKLSEIKTVEFYYGVNGLQSDSITHKYHWNTAGNIDKVTFTNFFNNQLDSLLFSYDNSANFFKALHPHYFVFDPNVVLYNAPELHMPHFYSKNNVAILNSFAGSQFPITYDLDSLNRLTTLRIDSMDYITYKYNCQ